MNKETPLSTKEVITALENYAEAYEKFVTGAAKSDPMSHEMEELFAGYSNAHKEFWEKWFADILDKQPKH